MQSEASDGDHQDSQNDQGFVINQLEIKNHQLPPLLSPSQTRPNDYLPRYISAHHLLRREMPEAAFSFPHFPHEDQPTINNTPRRKSKQLPLKQEQQNQNGKNYRLVYQRYAKRMETTDYSTGNDVSLESVVSYSPDNYSLTKLWEMPTANSDDLCFESRFECGNLMMAYRSTVEAHSYKLLLQNDTNSKGYNRWFYFAVSNGHKGVSYKLQITNFRKHFQFFRQGMRPTCFSLQQHRETGNGWSKCGRHLHFNKTDSCEDYYTLSFQFEFDYNDDICLFSLLPPYSYSKLTNFLLQANQNAQERTDIKFSLTTVAYSLTNTQVPQVTISAPTPATKNIVILARQHPGQVWSSFLAEAIIRQLMREPSADRDWLLQNYNFCIFPMVNVDGVLLGNFRCDLSGMDMNRNWKNPNKLLHPHLIGIKEEIRRLSQQGGVATCLDLHSHSKDYNVFAYCCRLDQPGKLLPFLLSRATPLFHFPSCTYGISKYKESTARAIIYDMTNADDVLTIESSFFASTNPIKVMHPATFLSFASAVLLSLKHYYSKTKYMLEMAEVMPKVIAEIAQKERTKSRKKVMNQSESGSDSQPTCDQIQFSEKIGNILPRCALVEASFHIKTQQKQPDEASKSKPSASLKKSKKKKKQKKQTKQLKQQHTVQQKPVQKPLQISRVQKPPLIALKNQKNNQFRKSLLQPMFKKRRDFSRQRKTLQTNTNRSYLNQSLELTFPNSNSKVKPSTEFRSTLKEKDLTSYQFHYRYEKKQKEQEEFPMLCVLSDRRKEAHLERLRRIHPTPSQRQRSVPHYQPTLVVNKKLDTIQRLRERQKKSSDLVSFIWQETVGPRSVFYGDL